MGIDDRIEKASKKIISRQQEPTPDLLIAELTLGFWTSLFHKRYAKHFWKPLMHSFPCLPTELKHRDKISYQLEQIRKFRNRIFHYEPVCNNLSALRKNHTAILSILDWLNKDITNWLPHTTKFEVLHRLAVDLLDSNDSDNH